MKFKVSINQKQIWIVLFIILICVFQNVQGEPDTDILTIEFDAETLNIPAGDSNSSIIFVNLTLDESEDIVLQGKWLGDQPEHVTVSFAQSSGVPPFTSYINFSTSQNEIGIFNYQVTATGDTITNSADIPITININNSISFQTENESYYNGEKLYLQGNISLQPKNNTILNDSVSITLYYGNWYRYLSSALDDFFFDCVYNISYGDPEGPWNITAVVEDTNGKQISYNTTCNVSLPTGTVRYKVVWFSPAENAIYQRGSLLNISIFITEDEVGVKNATTICTLPTLEQINLTEIKRGYYKESYQIPWDAQIGLMVLTVESKNDSGSTKEAGGSVTTITIKSTPLQIQLLQPSKFEYQLGDTIDIVVNVTYPDNTTVTDANITAEILTENISLSKQDYGIYSGSYTITDEYTGSFFINFYGSDEYDNSGSKNVIIQIIEIQQYSFPFVTIIGTIVTIIIIFLLVYFVRNRFSKQHFKDIKEELNEVKKLQNEAATKYYKKGSISRQTYDMLRKDHTERLAELKKEDKKLIKPKKKK